MAAPKRRVANTEVEKPAKDVPVVEADTVFVNRKKFQRATAIVELLTGKNTPKTTEEADLKERFIAHFADAGVTPKDKEAVRFVYEKLGGLVRTPDEQAEADADAAAAKKQNKKRLVEEDK